MVYSWRIVKNGGEFPLTSLGAVNAGALVTATVEQIVGESVLGVGGTGSGQPMPTGNVVSNGKTWVPAVSEDFTTDAAIGAFRAAYSGAAGHMQLYPEASGGGKYLSDQTISAHDSMMDIYVRHIGSVDAGAAMQVARTFAGPWNWTGGRFAVRFRCDPSAGTYGAAFQLWPTSNVWAEGEMDYPEGDFGSTTNLYHHEVGANPGNNYLIVSGISDWNNWHTAVIEWVPGVSVRYYMDGVLVGAVTTAAQVATTEHNYVIQTAAHTDTADGALDTASGHLQVDWIVIYDAT